MTASSGVKSWKKCFSVIDYNQNKNDSICQFTFKVRLLRQLALSPSTAL